MKCPFCGRGVKEGAALCRACGNILDPALGAAGNKASKHSGFTQIVELEDHDKTATDVDVSVDVEALRAVAKLPEPDDPTVIRQPTRQATPQRAPQPTPQPTAQPTRQPTPAADPSVLKRAARTEHKRTTTGEMLLAIEAEIASKELANKDRLLDLNDRSATEVEIVVNLEALRTPSSAERTIAMPAVSELPREADPSTMGLTPGSQLDPSTIPVTIRPPSSTTEPPVVHASPAPELSEIDDPVDDA